MREESFRACHSVRWISCNVVLLLFIPELGGVVDVGVGVVIKICPLGGLWTYKDKIITSLTRFAGGWDGLPFSLA